MQQVADTAAAPRPEHLAPTAFIDSDHPVVRAFARDAIGAAADGGAADGGAADGDAARDGAAIDPDQLRRLFAAVRDAIRYDPYSYSADPAENRASSVI